MKLYTPEPIDMTALGAQPVQFCWRGERYRVIHASPKWRVRIWRESIWREYCKLVTQGGQIVLVFRDLAGGGWYLQGILD
jgi:hypothetical protein